MRKKKISKAGMVVSLLTTVAVLLTYFSRVLFLNRQYPSAEILTADTKRALSWEGLYIQPLSGEVIEADTLFETYDIDPASLYSDVSAEKFAVFQVNFTKEASSPLQKIFFLEYSGAEKNGWSNLVAPEVFHAMNPEYVPPFQMELGEKQTVLFAVGLHRAAFSRKSWEALCIEQLSLDLSLYPTKVMVRV